MTSNFRALTSNIFLLPTPFRTRHLLSGGVGGKFRQRERKIGGAGLGAEADFLCAR